MRAGLVICGHQGPLWWECKLGQCLWRTIWNSYQNRRSVCTVRQYFCPWLSSLETLLYMHTDWSLRVQMHRPHVYTCTHTNMCKHRRVLTVQPGAVAHKLWQRNWILAYTEVKDTNVPNQILYSCVDFKWSQIIKARCKKLSVENKCMYNIYSYNLFFISKFIFIKK